MRYVEVMMADVIVPSYTKERVSSRATLYLNLTEISSRIHSPIPNSYKKDSRAGYRHISVCENNTPVATSGLSDKTARRSADNGLASIVNTNEDVVFSRARPASLVFDQ